MKAWTVAAWMAAVIEATGMAASQSVPAQSSQQSQIEKGRVAVTQVCIGCHGGGIMRMLEVRERSAQEWRETVYRMISRGAQVFPDEVEPLTAYLAASAGRRRAQVPGTPGTVSGAGQSAAASATTQDRLGAEANAILARRCQQCHDMARAATKPASERWQTIIDRMVTLGASVTPAEQQTLIEYLTRLEN